MESITGARVRLVALSALMLFLELALIRWTGEKVLYLSFFANVVLLESFLGIGLGFLAARYEREWFRLLQQVQGVGTKVALAILSTLSTSEIGNAIALQDKAMIGRANGVGKKLAERIVLELKDKTPAFAPPGTEVSKLAAELDAPRPTAASDAVSALVNLGYGQAQAGAAVSAAMRKAGDGQPTEKLIRLALKELALT